MEYRGYEICKRTDPLKSWKFSYHVFLKKENGDLAIIKKLSFRTIKEAKKWIDSQ